MTAILDLLTALLKYFNIFHGIVQSAYFRTVKTTLSPQNALILIHTYYARVYANIIASSVYTIYTWMLNQ